MPRKRAHNGSRKAAGRNRSHASIAGLRDLSTAFDRSPLVTRVAWGATRWTGGSRCFRYSIVGGAIFVSVSSEGGAQELTVYTPQPEAVLDLLDALGFRNRGLASRGPLGTAA